jgi:uncharacterized protein (TIGR03083 family)
VIVKGYLDGVPAPVPRFDAVPMLPVERDEFLDLLASLTPHDWEQPTECPAWTVKGVALHVLGDDLSLLSRQRDAATEGLTLEAARPGAPTDHRGVLDAFNERWVDAATFVGTPLLIELLRVTGELTHEWYARVDPDAPGEAVLMFGDSPASYWRISAREYLERFIHHAQIRRALGRPALDDPRFVVPAVEVVTRAFPRALAILDAPEATAIVLTLDAPARAWSFVRTRDGWELRDGDTPDPAVRLPFTTPDAASLFSRGLDAADIPTRVRVDGDDELGATIVAGLAAAFGR